MRVLLFCLALAWPLGVLADGLPPAVSRALSNAGIPEDAVAILVQPVGAAPVLAHNPDAAFNPASVMKLVTTAAALDRWGPSHAFTTRVVSEGVLQGDRLQGHLYLQGGGDPALTQPRLWALLRELRQRGIRHIDGDVVLDDSLYALPPEDPAGFDAAPLRPYNAPPSGMMLNHNSIAVSLRPEADQLLVTLDPPVLPVTVTAKVDAYTDCAAWREDQGFELRDGSLWVRGRYPAACGPRTVWLNLLPPAQNSLAHVDLLLRELDIRVTGRLRFGPAPEGAQEWLIWRSPPLSQIVHDINKWSNNLMAKALFLNLGIAHTPGPATWDKARQQMRTWLAGLGITGVQIDNGAGLSRSARISAAQLARVLGYTAQQPFAAEFMASLPIWGRDGTLKTRTPDHPAAGRARLKTGSLNGSRTLAGFVQRPDTPSPWILVMLVNHPRAGQAHAAQEALLEWAFQTVPTQP